MPRTRSRQVDILLSINSFRVTNHF